MLKHRLNLSLFLFLSMFVWPWEGPMNVFSQVPSHIISRYTVDMGLAQSTVNCLLRDRQGFLWIGTCGGLSRFDGQRFISFIHQPGSSDKLSDQYVRRLYQDSLGYLWIGTEEGLDRYDPTTGILSNMFHDSLHAGKTWYIPFHDAGGYLYFAEGIHGIWRMDARHGNPTNVLRSDLFTGITNQCADDDSGCWLNIAKCMAYYHYRKNKIEFFQLPDGGQQVFGILAVPGKNLLIATNRGLVQPDRLTRRFVPVPGFGQEPVFACCMDAQNQYWFSLGKECLMVCDSAFNNIVSYNKGKANDKEHYPASLSCLYADKEGNIWAGTDGNGLYHIKPSLSRFPVFQFGKDAPSQANFIRSFFRTKEGMLYTGTYDAGLYQVNLKNRQYQRVTLRKGNFEPGATISSICRLGQGLFVATSRGYAWYDPLHTKILAAGLPGNLQDESWSSFQAACAVDENTVLAAGYGFWCIYKVQPDGQLSESYDTIPRLRFSSLYSAGGDTILAGMVNHGLVRFVIRDSRLVEEKNLTSGAFFRDTHFRAFLKDRYKHLWAATSIGLMRLNSKLEMSRLYTREDGLANNDTYGVLEDAKGTLWITTSHGISRMDPRTGTFRSFGMTDGLQSEEFNRGACYRDNEGNLYLGGVNGFNYFSPEDIQLNPILPKPVITRLFINGETGDHLAEINDKKIRLKFFQNFLTIEVAALELSRPEMNRYAFLLEGQDKDWVSTGTVSLIRYNNLQPGRYVFWVKAANNDEVWCDPVPLLTIDISPPFWKTLWFRLLILLLVFIIVFLTMRRYFNRKLMRERELIRRKQEIEQLRSNIARDLHDTAGATLTRISMMGELAKRDLERNKDISVRLDSITATSRSLVDSFGEIIWATNPEHDNLESLAAYLRHFISEFTADLPLEISICFPDKIPDIKLKPDARHHLFLIARESINNAVKHADANLLEIVLQIEEKWLIMSIQDDGKGMDTAQKDHAGNGLRFIQKRAHEIGAQVHIESEKGRGSKITIKYLP